MDFVRCSKQIANALKDTIKIHGRGRVTLCITSSKNDLLGASGVTTVAGAAEAAFGVVAAFSLAMFSSAPRIGFGGGLRSPSVFT